MIKRIIVTGDRDRPINQLGNISFFYKIGLGVYWSYDLFYKHDF